MRYRLPFVSCTLILAVAACGKPDPVANNLTGANFPPTANNTVQSSPSGGLTSTPATAAAEPGNEVEPPKGAEATEAALIPAALHGRWGLTPGDCTSALGDAKGLLVINGRELRFYESRAVPSPGIDVEGDSITGNFRFTGEGETWTKFEKLERRDNKLVRTESNPAASFIYAKC
jgi:hypothetical protein